MFIHFTIKVLLEKKLNQSVACNFICGCVLLFKTGVSVYLFIFLQKKLFFCVEDLKSEIASFCLTLHHLSNIGHILKLENRGAKFNNKILSVNNTVIE